MGETLNRFLAENSLGQKGTSFNRNVSVDMFLA